MPEFEPEKDLLIYFKPGEPEVSSRDKKLAPVAAFILLAVIVPSALGWLPIAATAVAGAVAIIMTPIAINAANLIGADPRGFCVAVVVASSAAFMMPYGHPAPFLVQEQGGYRGRDYVHFGIGLNVLTLAVILLLVPRIWPA